MLKNADKGARRTLLESSCQSKKRLTIYIFYAIKLERVSIKNIAYPVLEM